MCTAARCVLVFAVALGACGKHRESVTTRARDTVAITVITTFPGASATEMAQSVATPLERQIGQVDHLEALHSRSTVGRSTVIAEFPTGTDPFVATQSIMAAVDKSSRLLPQQLPSPPMITRASHAGAVMRLTLGSKTLPLGELARAARDVLAQKLEQVAGVGDVEVCGPDEVTRITIDPAALAATGKTIDDVRTAIVASSLPQATVLPGQVTVRAADPVDGAAAFAQLPIVRDVARVETSDSEPSCVALARGQRVVGVTVIPQVGADPLEVRERLEAILPKVKAELPPDLYVDVWPRARPLAFEIMMIPTTSQARRIEMLQQALTEARIETRSLVQLGLVDRDRDIADLRIEPPTEHLQDLEPRMRAAFEHHRLTVRDHRDHVVGFTGPDPAALRAQADALEKALARDRQLHVVEQIGGVGEPQQTLTVDRDRASAFGITSNEIDSTLRVLAPGGIVATTTFTQLSQTQVMLAVAGALPEVLGEVMVRSTNSGLVPLSSVVTATETREPAAIFHEGQFPWVGVRIAGPLDALHDALAKLPVPADIQRDVREPD